MCTAELELFRSPYASKKKAGDSGSYRNFSVCLYVMGAQIQTLVLLPNFKTPQLRGTLEKIRILDNAHIDKHCFRCFFQELIFFSL